MAEIIRVNGDTVAPSEQIGRDVVWLGVTCANAVLNDAARGGSETWLDDLRKIIDGASSITIIGGTATDTDVMFMVEGLGFGGAGQPTAQEEADAIDALIVAGVPALGAVDVTFNDITGVAFVANTTSA